MNLYEEHFLLTGPRGGSHCHTTSFRPVPSKKGVDMSNISRRQFFGSTAAVAAVHPWCVDVAGGTEATPGRKDPNKVYDFIRKAKQ